MKWVAANVLSKLSWVIEKGCYYSLRVGLQLKTPRRKNSKILRLKEVSSAGLIIWNYLSNGSGAYDMQRKDDICVHTFSRMY